jgi:predicted kinase
MFKSQSLGDQWWRLLFLAIASFSVPIIVITGLSSSHCRNRIADFKDLATSDDNTSNTNNQKSSPRSKINNSSPKVKTATSTSSSPSSSSPLTQKRQLFGLSKSYSVEESSCENSTVYLPENVALGSLTTLGLQQPFVIAMVGLPARGKSHIVKMIIRYLRWTGFEAEVFNVGSYRRREGLSGMNSDFFSNDNKDAKQLREELAREVQNIMYTWLQTTEESTKGKGRVAIFDATNTTVDRRQELCNRARDEHVGLLFVESICDDAKILEANYLSKLNNDDYRCMDKATAKEDFVKRVAAYEKVFHSFLYMLLYYIIYAYYLNVIFMCFLDCHYVYT